MTVELFGILAMRLGKERGGVIPCSWSGGSEVKPLKLRLDEERRGVRSES